MPYVELLSMGSALDMCLIQKLNDENLVERHPEPIAVNLTLHSISDLEFHRWLDKFLSKSQLRNSLCFELPETAVYSVPENCEALCNVIHKHGFQIGIDHFGRQFGSMNYLQTLRPSYVKLDQAFAHYGEEQHNSELCRALVNVAKGLSIEVIVTGIQEREQLDCFHDLNVQGFQGFITPPEDV